LVLQSPILDGNRPSANHNLQMPTYRTPTFRYGQRVACLARGEVEIVGLTDAPGPWPIAKVGLSPVVHRDLAADGVAPVDLLHKKTCFAAWRHDRGG
jgi:hypothetical protein